MDSPSSSKINYFFVPSLKHLALVKIASTVWNQHDVRNLLTVKYSDENVKSKKDWLAIEGKVIEKVPELQLPRELGKDLTYYIQQVGFQIHNWINFHVVQYRYVAITELPREFFWMPLGNIDYKKVAETIVSDNRLESYTRFKLSCIYCLEKNINFLWNEVPKHIYEEETVESIVRIWSRYLAGKLNHLTFLKLGYLESVYTGCEAGTRYFLPRFTLKQRNIILAKVRLFEIVCYYMDIHSHPNICFPQNQYINNIFYLLSEMNEQQQTKFIEFCCQEILKEVLNWPFQYFFLKIAENLCRFLYPQGFYNLIITLIRKKMISATKGYDYQKLFVELWQRNSDDKKRYTTKTGLKLLLPDLFTVGDKESIKLFFEPATVLEKEEFIFCNEGQLICSDLIEAANWNLLKFFIEECTSSKKAFQKLKEKLKKMFYSVSSDVKLKEGYEFYQLLHDIERKNKRKYINDEISSFTKKLCS